MKKLSWLVTEGFIWGVGITRPQPGKAAGAGRYITALFFGTLAAVAALFLLVVGRF